MLNIGSVVAHKMPFHIDKYDTSHLNAGVALIFNHLKYQDKKIPERKGSLEDTINLEKVLKEFGFDVRIFMDQTLEKIKLQLHKGRVLGIKTTTNNSF